MSSAIASIVKSLQLLFTGKHHEKPASPAKVRGGHRMDEQEVLRLKILGTVLKK